MSNTVGSLTRQQKLVILGCVLGDGYLRIVPGRKNAFLETNHSIKAKEYVDWKYEVLKSICLSPPKRRVIDKRRIGYRFFTRQHQEITKIYKLFYPQGKKIIPKNMQLSELTLAVWFMDDGSKTKKGDVYLNTQQFSLDDQKRLLYFLRKLKLRARLNKDKKYHRIRFYHQSVGRLVKLIKPYIIPSMEYKIAGL